MDIRKTLNQISPFSFFEKVRVLTYTIAQRIVTDTPLVLRECYSLVIFLKKNGINVSRKKESIFFDYKVEKLSQTYYLKRNSSDPMVFEQIIIDNEYKIVINFLKKSNPLKPIMIDLGANIGMTSLYFKAFFPDIRIIALEPEPKIFKRLEKNIKENNFKDIKLLNKGIWSYTIKLEPDYSFRDGEDWSFRLIESKDNSKNAIEVVTLEKLIEIYNLHHIHFLKIDIEGSEKDLFRDDAYLEWLYIVEIISIEIHDEFNIRKKIQTILIKYGFTLHYSGEILIGINTKFN